MTILSSPESARRADEGKNEAVFIASPYLKYLAGGLKVAVFLSLFLIAAVVRADGPLDIVVNEIAWMGTKIEDVESKNWWRYEWMELYNNTGQLISLEGWKIELYRTKPDWSLELKGDILPQSYFLIVASDKIFSNYDFNYFNLGGKLNNSGQKVVLKDATGTIIDEIDCSPGWFAGDNNTKQTMERVNPVISENNASNWQTSATAGGTPKSQNSAGTVTKTEPIPVEPIPTKEEEVKTIIENQQSGTDSIEDKPVEIGSPQTERYPTGIVFNEILPSPEGPDETEEWIEILNQNNFGIDLSGWQISDTAGKTYTLPVGTKILAQGFLVLPRPTTKITLNNDEDGLSLIQPNGNILDSVNYQKAPQGQSYNRTESGWTWSSTLTPGSANIIPAPSSKIKDEEKNKEEPQKELAAVSESFRQIQEKQISKPLFTFLVALGLAIFSGVIILIFKKKLKNASGID